MKKTVTRALLATACLLMAGGAAIAKAPYYFVDSMNNKQYLYTDPSCSYELDECVGFATACGTNFYSRPYSLEQGKDQLRYTGIVTIRENSGNVPIYCNIKK